MMATLCRGPGLSGGRITIRSALGDSRAGARESRRAEGAVSARGRRAHLDDLLTPRSRPSRAARADFFPTAPRPIVVNNGEAMFWSGLTMLGAGLTLEILSFTALKKETGGCLVTYYTFACASETSTNTPVMITGLIVGTIGGVMSDFGWKKMHPMVTIGRQSTTGVGVKF
jgi:hypothetical protein